MNTSDILRQLYLTYIGHEPEDIRPLTAAGSNRRYFRLTGQPTLIGVQGESADENRAFLYLARHLREKGLPVPQVHAHTADNLCYLQEDLGDTLLFDVLTKSPREALAARPAMRGSLRAGLQPLLPAIRLQPALRPLGLELLQILLLESYGHRLPRRPFGG